jgi:hypothetical protein
MMSWLARRRCRFVATRASKEGEVSRLRVSSMEMVGSWVVERRAREVVRREAWAWGVAGGGGLPAGRLGGKAGVLGLVSFASESIWAFGGEGGKGGGGRNT